MGIDFDFNRLYPWLFFASIFTIHFDWLHIRIHSLIWARCVSTRRLACRLRMRLHRNDYSGTWNHRYQTWLSIIDYRFFIDVTFSFVAMCIGSHLWSSNKRKSEIDIGQLHDACYAKKKRVISVLFFFIFFLNRPEVGEITENFSFSFFFLCVTGSQQRSKWTYFQ